MNTVTADVRPANPVVTNRRMLLAGAVILPVVTSLACADPAAAKAKYPASTFRIAEARYRVAEANFNALPQDLETTDPAAFKRAEQALFETVGAVDAAPATDWQEFADAFEIATDGGVSLPNEELVMKLLRDVRRLRGRAAA